MFQFLYTTPLFTFQGLTIKKREGMEKKMKNSHKKAGTGRKKNYTYERAKKKETPPKIKRTYG